MSAGTMEHAPRVDQDLSKLAPRFRSAVGASIRDCEAAGLDAMVFEGLRSPELQALYYERGRTIVPPHRPVTNARSNLYSWHGFGLAVDVISREHHWDRPESWFEEVARHFQANGCRWGGEWRMKDLPHFQWHTLRPSPSDRARELFASGGFEAVWEEVLAV